MNTDFEEQFFAPKKIKKLIDILKISFIIAGILLFLIGFYFVYAKFDSAFEIKHVNEGNILQVYKQSYIPPFKTLDFVMNNAKRAILNSEKETGSTKKYFIEIENYNNNKTKLSDSSYLYYSQKDLSKRINNAIQNNENFSYINKPRIYKIMGFVFIFMSFVTLLVTFIVFKKLQVAISKHL